MNILWTIVAVLLGAAALLGTARLLIGPSILDRALSVDVLLASALTGLGAYAAFNRDPTVLPTLLVLSILGFVGSISVSKFVARRPEEHADNPVEPTEDSGERRTS
ncbi:MULTISPECIES: monovalent cation/H+ antiporter complex subunit F [Nocardiopsis]|jgi:multicomponent Na+:H+ antiporter subunit F|uniref:Cation:proton antiporter n=2 Tax=Nocardiopsis alba TaxID=53437 RepID=A0A7K2ITM7_9ACTN|nr:MULTISPECIES: monovalent cation/H+ antiporter complex subunit F [Nocardiopsis]AFR08850.1 multiple resistance and pH regulation F family protein [Nocardiopsis alba ATCC BAA-2165]MEC3893733.1 monovalent cation/H+ antiporter complex subunit F [Nocardiopsis sp. LDBS1602]MYR33319.1 cation:proton antiporter [Nocardiopsis alba]